MVVKGQFDTDDLPLGVDPDAPWQEWMVTGGNTEPVEILIEIQDYIDSLPVTAGTFQLPDATDAAVSTFDERMIEQTGAWPLPEHYPDTTHNGKKWVNPNYMDSHLYSEVVTKCECGAVMVRRQEHRIENVLPLEHNHGEECRKDWRLHARARLAEKRRRVAKRILLRGDSIRANRERLGMKRESLASEAEELNLDPPALKREGQRRLARTWVRLLRRYPPSKVAEAYRVSGQKVRRYVNDYTDLTATDLYHYRHA